MNVLNKLVLRNFFLNKKRTIVTIIGILLSTALITAIASMAESFRASMVEYEKNTAVIFTMLFMMSNKKIENILKKIEILNH